MDAKRIGPKEFTLGAVEPGTKARFLVKVGELATGAPMEIPVVVIAGRARGPKVFVGAGQHGEEPAGMDAVMRVAAELQPGDVKGTAVLVPLQNPPAWAFRSRHFPLDAPNPGDVAGLQSGDPEGIMSARVFSAVADSICAEVEYGLDVHATHLDSLNYPRTMVTITGNEPEDVQRKRLEMGRAVGYELIHLWKRPGHGGVTGYLNRRGTPTIAIEAGEGWRTLEPFPSILARGIRNFLKYAGSIGGTLELPALQVESTKRHEIAAHHGGLSQLRVKPGDYVRTGQLLATVHNMFNDVVDELRSPANGIIVRCSLLPTVATGARVCNVYESDREEWANRELPALERQIVVSGFTHQA